MMQNTRTSNHTMHHSRSQCSRSGRNSIWKI